MSYITKNFLLENKYAKKLYFNYASKCPIFDYHCHLSEKEILEDKPFDNIAQIWLKGDHYKWRLMRNAGVDESYITGNKTDKEKFVKYCEVLSFAFGNPLYHWSQLELKEYFDCNLEINAQNACKIWDYCNEYIHLNKVSPSTLISKSNVKIIFTTNEIFDDLTAFKEIKNKGYSFKVIPTFRADKIMNIEADTYIENISKIGECLSLDELEINIENRLKKFIEVGCVASDIALEKVEPVADKNSASKVFIKRRSGKPLDNDEISIFKGYLTYFLLKLYSKFNIKCEFHIGAMRNNSSQAFLLLGPDSGFDSISEQNSTFNLSKLMNKLETEKSLPQMIIFNLNPKFNIEILALINCFQDSSSRGKIQYGPAWWFLDNKQYILKHLDDVTAEGNIGVFIGMLTDSRSFVSFARHQYFRRLLCNYFGKMIERGEMTSNIKFVGKIVENISYNNAITYFNIII